MKLKVGYNFTFLISLIFERSLFLWLKVNQVVQLKKITLCAEQTDHASTFLAWE